MTTPNQVPPYLDPSNPLLATGPSRLDVGTVDLPETGKLGIFTVRTPSTTLTVMLSAEDLRTWAGIMNTTADQLESSLSQVAPEETPGS